VISGNSLSKNTYAREGNNLAFNYSKEDVTKDFGNIQVDIKGKLQRSYTFKLKNTLDIPISIKKVVTSCGCTSPDYSKEKVKPGDYYYVKLTYSPTRDEKYFRKTANIIYEQKDLRHVMLTIHGNQVFGNK
jgi:hypothetical protein